MPPEELGGLLMPLGELQKAEVRERARRAGLPVYDKPDSTGICFIGERPFREFLARYLPRTPGAIESADGEGLGTHEGLAFYTLGQRAGLNIGGRAGRPEEPWYVADKDAARNVLIVVQGHDHPRLSSQRARKRPLALAGPPAPRARSAPGSRCATARRTRRRGCCRAPMARCTSPSRTPSAR